MFEKLFGQLKKWLMLWSILPFIIGAIGYFLAGEDLTDALYCSFSLYFVEMVSDAHNLLIEIARWTSALVTTTAILYAIKRLSEKISNTIKCLGRDSVAVYSDIGKKIVFSSPKYDVVYPGRELYLQAKSQIIMFDTDIECLTFYEQNRAKLADKRVFIGLKDISCGLLKETTEVTFFDIDSAVARNLWQKIRLWKKQNAAEQYTITIIGNGHLGQNILNNGLLLNIFSLQQSLTYNLVGDNRLYSAVHADMCLFNNDRICYYSADDKDIRSILTASDLIVIADKVSVEELQTISVICRKSQIYYYAPEPGCVGEYLKLNNLYPFGRDKDIYTDENIRGGKLVKAAQKLNFEYAKKYGNILETATPDTEWCKLDGFLKWSNVSSADYNDVIRDIAVLDSVVNIETLAAMEHLRWCRFHLLNHWSYGVPANGRAKDSENRIHKCLCAYSELAEKDKEKDRAVVRSSLSYII